MARELFLTKAQRARELKAEYELLIEEVRSEIVASIEAQIKQLGEFGFSYRLVQGGPTAIHDEGTDVLRRPVSMASQAEVSPPIAEQGRRNLFRDIG